MNVILHPEARIEYLESIQFYESREPGLGLRFKDEVDVHMNLVSSDPLRFRERKSGYRRANLSVFPHYIAYLVRDDLIWVVAIAHGRRKPEFWINRTEGI